MSHEANPSQKPDVTPGPNKPDIERPAPDTPNTPVPPSSPEPLTVPEPQAPPVKD